MSGTHIELQAADGTCNAYVARPAGPGPFPAVLFLMDGIGLRETLERMADRVADKGYLVLLPNLYYRSGAFAPFDPAKVFAGGPELDRAKALMDAIGGDESAMRDVGRFLDWFDGQPEVIRGKAACLGYCLGGGFALRAACAYPKRVALAASFHGGGFVADASSPAVIADRIQSRVYLGVAEIDRRHTPAVTEALEAALTEARVPHAIELYPGTKHGFAVADVPAYDEAAAERHWQRLSEQLWAAFQ